MSGEGALVSSSASPPRPARAFWGGGEGGRGFGNSVLCTRQPLRGPGLWAAVVRAAALNLDPLGPSESRQPGHTQALWAAREVTEFVPLWEGSACFWSSALGPPYGSLLTLGEQDMTRVISRTGKEVV